MNGYSKVILLGRLAQDPEIRYTQSNVAICTGSIATKFVVRRKDGSNKEEVTYTDFKIFGKRAEPFERYHKKGDVALLDGRLTMDTWEDKNTGAKRTKLYVTVENWEFAGTKQDRQPAGPEPGGFSPSEDDPF